MSKKEENKVKVSISLSPEALRALDEMAKISGLSRSALIEKSMGFGLKFLQKLKKKENQMIDLGLEVIEEALKETQKEEEEPKR